MAEIRLLVTPDKLRQASGQVRGVLRTMRGRISRIADISSRTRGYWRGYAGELDRDGFSECLDELLAVVKDMEERAVTLEKLAGVYQSVEEAAESESFQLETARISRREVLRQ